jgi:hypothetical protein
MKTYWLTDYDGEDPRNIIQQVTRKTPGSMLEVDADDEFGMSASSFSDIQRSHMSMRSLAKSGSSASVQDWDAEQRLQARADAQAKAAQDMMYAQMMDEHGHAEQVNGGRANGPPVIALQVPPPIQPPQVQGHNNEVQPAQPQEPQPVTPHGCSKTCALQ